MALNVGEIIYKITGDDTSLRSVLSNTSKSVANVLSTCAKAAAAASAAAAAAVTAMAKAAIDSYAEYEQLVGGVKTLFKDSAETVQQYANNAYQTAGLSANAYMETVTSFSASLLQGLGGDTAAAAEIANQAIVDMADNANKMGTDMASIQNAYQGFAKQNYTMLDNLKLGYGGTQSEMARLINDSGVLGDEITVTADTVNQVSFDKIIEAIHVVQENLGITGTTAEEAASTIQGSASAMKAAWQNLLTGMADPTQNYEALINNLVNSVTTFIKNVVPRLEVVLPQIATGIDEIVAELLPQLAEIIETLLPEVISGVSNLVSVLIDTLTDTLTASAPIILENAENVIDVFIDGVIGALPQLAKAAAEIILELVEKLLDSDNITTIVETAAELISVLAEAISNSLPTLLPVAVNAIMTFVDELIQNIDLLLDAAFQIINALADGLINSIPVILEKVPTIIVDLCTALVDAIPDTIDFCIDFCEAIVKGLASYDWSNIGKNMYEGIVDALSRALNGDDYAEKKAEEHAKKIASYGNASAEGISNTVVNLQEKVKKYQDYLNQIADEGYVTADLYNSLPEEVRRGAEAMNESVQQYMYDMISDANDQISTLTDVYTQLYSVVDDNKEKQSESLVYTPDDTVESDWEDYENTVEDTLEEAGDTIDDYTETVSDSKEIITNTLDTELEDYKDFNDELLKEQENTNEEIESETESSFETQRKKLKEGYEQLISDRDELADSMAVSTSEIFTTKETVNPYSGEKTEARVVDTESLERKVKARSELVSKISELIDKDTPDSIIDELLNADPEAALDYAEDLLKNPKKLTKIKSLFEEDEESRNAIADMVMRNSDEYKELGEEAGELFSDGFAAAFKGMWSTAFEDILSDADTLSGLSLSTLSAGAGISAENTFAPVITAVPSTGTVRENVKIPFASASTDNTVKLVDVNGTWLMNLVTNAQSLQNTRSGG